MMADIQLFLTMDMHMQGKSILLWATYRPVRHYSRQNTTFRKQQVSVDKGDNSYSMKSFLHIVNARLSVFVLKENIYYSTMLCVQQSLILHHT